MFVRRAVHARHAVHAVCAVFATIAVLAAGALGARLAVCAAGGVLLFKLSAVKMRLLNDRFPLDHPPRPPKPERFPWA